MFNCNHVIELVAKTAVSYKKKQDKELKVDVSERYLNFLIFIFLFLFSYYFLTLSQKAECNGKLM